MWALRHEPNPKYDFDGPLLCAKCMAELTYELHFKNWILVGAECSPDTN
jgi:hypothetical protein